jgi:mono/diheme cytochrome c family protein
MKRVQPVIVFTLLVLTACGGRNSSSGSEPISTPAPVPEGYAGKTNPFGPDAADKGAEIFGNNCETCHGSQGQGDGPAGAALDPPPKNLAELQKIAADDYLFWRISSGKEGTSMVAWKGILSEEQIWQVVSFIRTLK